MSYIEEYNAKLRSEKKEVNMFKYTESGIKIKIQYFNLYLQKYFK